MGNYKEERKELDSLIKEIRAHESLLEWGLKDLKKHVAELNALKKKLAKLRRKKQRRQASLHVIEWTETLKHEARKFQESDSDLKTILTIIWWIIRLLIRLKINQ